MFFHFGRRKDTLRESILFGYNTCTIVEGSPMLPDSVTSLQLAHLQAAAASWPAALDGVYDSPFLRLFVSAEREQLSQSFFERRCLAGEVVFREDSIDDKMYIILSGKVSILKGELDSPTILAFQGVGEIFGEMALLQNRPRSATVICIEDARLLGLDRQSFQQLLQEMPWMSYSIMELLSARLRLSDEWRNSGEASEKRLIDQVTTLETQKQRLEELQRLRQETSELIVHDLRNPLGAIAVAAKMLALLLPEEALEPNRELVEIISTSTERMQRLVDSLLEVSRMETGESPFVWVPLDLVAMVRDVVKRLSLVDKRGIVLKTQIEPHLPFVLADRDKIERVLTNLLDNALKFTPENGWVRVDAFVREQQVWIAVTDSGPGIALADREHIFERFAQGQPERGKRRGFGLGLAYCRLAVQGHAGKIWVEAGEDGQGSKFIFTLPVDRN